MKEIYTTKLINEEDRADGRIAETAVNDMIKQSNKRWKSAAAKLHE